MKCDSRVNLSPLDLAELNPLPEMSIMIFREVMEMTASKPTRGQASNCSASEAAQLIRQVRWKTHKSHTAEDIGFLRGEVVRKIDDYFTLTMDKSMDENYIPAEI